jgi:hypothetical protein
MKRVLMFLFFSAVVVNFSYSQCSYTYTNQTSGVTSLFYTVKAVDANVGWAAGAGSVVRRTVNGGATWTNGNSTPGVITGDIYNIEAIDSMNAWVTTSPGATFIYRTVNGGVTWVQVFTQAAPSFINVISMQTPLTGFASGDPVSFQWVILTTVDGGATWTPLATAPTSVAGEDGRNNSMQVMLPNIWFGTGQGKVYRTNTSGATWTNSPSTIATQITALHFNSSIIGFGMAGGASLVKSPDLGVTFSALTSMGTGTITGIDGDTDSTYIYSRGTGIFLSTNSGASFTLGFTGPGTYQHMDLSLAGTCLKGWAVTTTGGITRIDGNIVGIEPISSLIPGTYSLSQNYPNPFNPNTNIKFDIPKQTFVKVAIYNTMGQEVANLVNEDLQAGQYEVSWTAANVSSGIYFYSIISNDFTMTKKMMLVK